MSTIAYFEFLVTYPDGKAAWHQLQGNGGAMGNGALYIPVEKIRPVCDRLLSRARLELARTGQIRLSNDADHSSPLRITLIRPQSIDCCRAIQCQPHRNGETSPSY